MLLGEQSESELLERNLEFNVNPELDGNVEEEEEEGEEERVPAARVVGEFSR